MSQNVGPTENKKEVPVHVGGGTENIEDDGRGSGDVVMAGSDDKGNYESGKNGDRESDVEEMEPELGRQRELAEKKNRRVRN